MSLLQFVLDRWWPHVVAISCVVQLKVISGVGGVILNTQNALFGMLVALGDHRAIQGHLGAQGGIR